MKLSRAYYQQQDVVAVARDLLGKKLITHFDGQTTSGIITETEAYAGITDRGSHAYGGRRTTRTETMYSPGGLAYIYLCYGIHALFNVVTGPSGQPHAVLIRSIEPLEGKELMIKRRKHAKNGLTDGPGKLTQALGIHTGMNAISLLKNTIWLEEARHFHDSTIRQGPRIGIDYAGADASLPYRFWVKHSGLL